MYIPCIAVKKKFQKYDVSLEKNMNSFRILRPTHPTFLTVNKWTVLLSYFLNMFDPHPQCSKRKYINIQKLRMFIVSLSTPSDKWHSFHVSLFCVPLSSSPSFSLSGMINIYFIIHTSLGNSSLKEFLNSFQIEWTIFTWFILCTDKFFV